MREGFAELVGGEDDMRWGLRYDLDRIIVRPLADRRRLALSHLHAITPAIAAIARQHEYAPAKPARLLQ